MFSDLTGCIRLAQNIERLSQHGGSGKLLLSSSQSSQPEAQEQPAESIGAKQWTIHFVQGNMLYAIGYKHRVRRWSRGLQQHCPNFDIEPMALPVNEPWEYQILNQGIAKQKLNQNQVKSIIRSTAQEVFFDLARYPWVRSQWQPALDDKQIKQVNPNCLLGSDEIQQLILRGLQLWDKWQEMDLTYICPDRAPTLIDAQQLKKQVSYESFVSLNTLFNGKNTIWDLAVKRKQSVLGLTRTLHHFIKTDKITLTDTSDLPAPLEQLLLVRAAIKQPAKKPLIACIDDSPMIAEKLAQILQPAGFRVLKINHPMQGVATLAEEKPDLIFLDVVMPQTNGYNVCSFLRHSSLFRNTPIIILTSQNGLIDRTRAKLNGASDFLSKPPEPNQVLTLVEKYLQQSTTKILPIGSPALA